MLEEASEIFKEIRLAISERLTSPLIGTYSISWFIWNFKFLLIIFDGDSVESKFVLIHDELFWNWWGYLLTYGGPALMTGAFIFVYPYPARLVYRFRLKFQQELNRIKQQEEDDELLSVADSRKLRLEIRDKERELNSRLDDAQQESNDLRKENAALRARFSAKGSSGVGAYGDGSKVDGTNENLDKTSNVIRPAGDLSALETAVMKAISSVIPEDASEKWIIDTVLSYNIDDDQIKTRARVGSAISTLRDIRRLISVDSTSGILRYSLSEAGEEFAVKYGI